MELTKNQIMIMTTLDVDGDPLDMDQLLENLPYKTSKESLQFSLRALIGKGLIRKGEKQVRRGRCRRIIELTEFGKSMVG